MSEWTEAVEAKARIIHGQLAAACAIAERNGTSADEIAQPYLELLRSLYREEFAFAQLVDTSDLVSRFVGPAVSGADPTVTMVTTVCHTLRNQIRKIAKSIVGLSDESVTWPYDLEAASLRPHARKPCRRHKHSFTGREHGKRTGGGARYLARDFRIRPSRGQEHCNHRTSRS